MHNDTVNDETNAGEASSAKDDASSSNKAVCDGKMKGISSNITCLLLCCPLSTIV